MRTPLGLKLIEDEDAQSVFHQTLLPHLVENGASSLEAIEQQGLKLFRLPLSGEEIADVVELARRKRLVEPLLDLSDAYGEEIPQVEWAPTQRGRQLRRPRGLTFAAFREFVVEVSPAGPKIAQAAQAAVGIFIAIPVLLQIPVLRSLLSEASAGNGTTAPAKTGLVVGAIAAAVCIATVLYRGMSGDAKLRHAARGWSRLEREWPKFWNWQVRTARPWLGLLAALLCVVPPAIRLAGGHGHWWLGVIYALGVLMLLVLAAVNQCRSKTRVARRMVRPPQSRVAAKPSRA